MEGLKGDFVDLWVVSHSCGCMQMSHEERETIFSCSVYASDCFFADLTVLDAFTMYCVISQQNDTMLSLLGIMLDMFAILLLSLACRIFFFFI